MLIDEHLVLSSSERILLLADGRGCRDAEKIIMWRDSKLEVSIVFLPSKLRESNRRERKKIVRVRGDGEHQEKRTH